MPRLSFAFEITLGSSLIVGERRVDLNEKRTLTILTDPKEGSKN